MDKNYESFVLHPVKGLAAFPADKAFTVLTGTRIIGVARYLNRRLERLTALSATFLKGGKQRPGAVF